MPRVLMGTAIFLPYVVGGVLAGLGQKQDSAALSVAGVGLILVGIVATFVLPSRSEAKRRRDLQRAAPTMGLFYMDDDPYGLAGLAFEWFRGKKGASSMVLEGEWSGLPLKAFAFRYLDSYVDAEGDPHAVTITRSCALAQMSAPIPVVEIEATRDGKWTFEVAGPKVLCVAGDFLGPRDLPKLFDALKGYVDRLPTSCAPPVQPTVHEVTVP